MLLTIKQTFTIMKKLLLNLSLLISMGAMAQDSAMTVLPEKKITDHYTVSGGLLGALNFSKFRVSGNDVSDFNFKSKLGWSGGVWLNFPFGKAVSFEPQVMYSSYKYESNVSNATAFTGNYFSVPLLFKFHLGSAFAITVGPQFDFLRSVKDASNAVTKDDFKKTSTSISGGIELFPHAPLTIFARYIHGLSNMDASSTATDGKLYNQAIQAGLKLKLFGKHIVPPPDTDGDGIADPSDKCPTQAGLAKYQGCPIPDSDGDGINDEEDKCPKEAGTAKYNGCPVPDTDKDGINDEVDKCPNEAGTAKYNGCPVPDSDGDGINDDEDKCPGVKGTAKYNGCPIPDTDNDGVNDEEDRCPTVAGVPENKGCPKIENFQANEVTFGSGKAVLTASGKRELDLAVAYMQKYADIKVRLDGHTDSSGTDKINQPLSVKRAEAAMAYLVSKGIDASRITAEGHGSSMPVAENKKPAGRAQNRRVEITIL